MHQRIDSYYSPRYHKVCGPSIQTYQCLQLGKTFKAQEEGRGGGNYFTLLQKSWMEKKIKHCITCCSLGTGAGQHNVWIQTGVGNTSLALESDWSFTINRAVITAPIFHSGSREVEHSCASGAGWQQPMEMHLTHVHYAISNVQAHVTVPSLSLWLDLPCWED